jgi:CHASE1-domain containing sensor protein
VQRDLDAALDLEQMLLTRSPEELFAAEDEADWNEWFEFFTRTREADGRCKGLVEITL